MSTIKGMEIRVSFDFKTPASEKLFEKLILHFTESMGFWIRENPWYSVENIKTEIKEKDNDNR